jgi:hypothetical protein
VALPIRAGTPALRAGRSYTVVRCPPRGRLRPTFRTGKPARTSLRSGVGERPQLLACPPGKLALFRSHWRS